MDLSKLNNIFVPTIEVFLGPKAFALLVEKKGTNTELTNLDIHICKYIHPVYKLDPDEYDGWTVYKIRELAHDVVKGSVNKKKYGKLMIEEREKYFFKTNVK
jgi:hypothetical protein